MPQRRSHFPGASSSTTPLKQRKALSPPPSSTPDSRRSKRIKSSPVGSASKATPKKSPYFEHPTSESERDPESEEEASGYEDEDASAVTSPAESSASEGDESSEYASSVEEKSAKRKRGRKPSKRSVPTPKMNGHTAPTTTTGQKTSELWRPGVKVTGEGEVFIPLPKARAAGSTPYKDSTIHSNTLLFLSDLRKNNDRDWLKTHDADYRASLRDWNSFVDALTPMIIEKDETIPELPNKDLTFRIYRDIRFSPDPTPYKTHFSAAWSRTGRKGPYAGYYVQIQPKGSFVGAGVWHPEAAPLALLRKAVDRHGDRLKEVLVGEELRKTYLGVAKKDEKECVKKFVALNGENALKTKPRVCFLSLPPSTSPSAIKGEVDFIREDPAGVAVEERQNQAD